jgi:6-phosphogluconolactonase (cycloisomerase 2 family)
MAVATTSRKLARGLMFAVFALLACALVSVSAQAQLNLVYVEISNPALHGNVVLGFSNDGAGNLTKLPHSPFQTKGFGTTGAWTDVQFDSDGEMIANAAGTLMFAVNGHSNTVTVFNINSDGTMRALPGPATPSGGQQPASLALKENVLPGNVSMMLVMNKASDPGQTGGVPNYTTFKVTTTGTMTLNAGSTFNLPTGTSPALVLPRPGKLVQYFADEFMNNKLVTYQANASGILTEISEALASSATLGAVVEPGTQKAVYVGEPMAGLVAAFSYDQLGNLALLNEVSNSGALICWMTENATGTRLYTSETMSGTVSVYDTTGAAKPLQLQHFSLAAGSLPAHVKLDPTGNFLYVVDRLGMLHVLTVSQVDGTLSEPNPPLALHLPAGSVPMAVVTLMK